MAMAWPLTRAGKISPIITHEMGPKLICKFSEALISPESRPESQTLSACAHGTAGRRHACMHRDGVRVGGACLLSV